MKFYRILLVLILVLYASCKINGSLQGLYSYYNKVNKAKPNLLVKPKTSICELKPAKTPKVYVVKGQDLKSCISSKKNVLVYIWGPKCKSDICYPLNPLQTICDENNVELLVLAEYYDAELMDEQYNLQRPIFGVDVEFYKQNLTSKYLPKFISDLTSGNYTNKDENRFLYFKNGEFIRSYNSVEEVFPNSNTKAINTIY